MQETKMPENQESNEVRHRTCQLKKKAFKP